MSAISLKKIKTILMAFCALLALVMIMDYILVGNTFAEEIIAIDKSFENYFNAGGNSHYSFKIQTENHLFPFSQDFASLARVGQEVQLKISPLFSEVDSAVIIETGNKEVYSLRVLSGLVLPVLVLLILTIGHKFGSKVSTLVFVMEVSIIANLVYLLN